MAWWVKNGEALAKEMPQHTCRVWFTVRDHWRTATVWKRENGKWHSVLHDLMNVPVEAGKVDSYFTVHWLVVWGVLMFIGGLLL